MLSRRAVIVGTLASMTVPGAALAKKSKKRRFRKQTRTRLFANPQPILINDENTQAGPSPYPSTIQVGGLPRGRTRKVVLNLFDLSHQVPNEVGMMLVAPDGRQAVIWRRVGNGSMVQNINVTLDDDAVQPLPDGVVQLTGGTFRPTDYGSPPDFPPPAPPENGASALATFNGGNPNGTWRLFVSDAVLANHSGDIAGGWSLQITAQVKIRKKGKKKNKKK